MKSWAVTLPNSQHPEMPREDFYAYDHNVFCVADGITRDPIGLKDFSKTTIKEALKTYPNPSPAAQAAELTVKTFVKFLVSNSVVDLKKALIVANQKVAELNQGLDCDYLENDFAGCVAVGGRIVNGNLEWVAIGDCQVCIFDKAGTRRFLSPDGTANFSEYTQAAPGNWYDPARRVEVRSQFRNNPQQFRDGKLVSYGALTGEKSAESFIMAEEQKLNQGDYVAFFSDGFIATMNHPEAWSELTKGKENFLEWDQKLVLSDADTYGRERTIIFLGGQ